REYQTRLEDESVKIMPAYEVSIRKLAAYENADNFDVDEEFELLGAERLERGFVEEQPYVD
ncbi:MAG: hypothetical protein IKZ38_04800, partial [Clostridia bacterium]|nr:hypothetical protein [Clostridia bacterium]